MRSVTNSYTIVNTYLFVTMSAHTDTDTTGGTGGVSQPPSVPTKEPSEPPETDGTDGTSLLPKLPEIGLRNYPKTWKNSLRLKRGFYDERALVPPSHPGVTGPPLRKRRLPRPDVPARAARATVTRFTAELSLTLLSVLSDWYTVLLLNYIRTTMDILNSRY